MMNTDGDENLRRRGRRRRRRRQAGEHLVIKLVVGVVFVGFLELLAMRLAGFVSGVTALVVVATLYVALYPTGVINDKLSRRGTGG